MILGALPLQLAHQVGVFAAGGDPDVVQQADIEQALASGFVQLEALGAHPGHVAHPLAMRVLVDADQVEGIGEGKDYLVEIDSDIHGSLQ